MSTTVMPSFEQMLKGVQLRVTKSRLAVLDSLARIPHADTASVIADVRTRHTSISHQAVYDCLAALAESGLVRRIQPMGSTARYELRVGDNHHHAVCRACGSITDVDCASAAAPCLDPGHPEDFTIDEAEVLYWGLCFACQQSPQPQEDPR